MIRLVLNIDSLEEDEDDVIEEVEDGDIVEISEDDGLFFVFG